MFAFNTIDRRISHDLYVISRLVIEKNRVEVPEELIFMYFFHKQIKVNNCWKQCLPCQFFPLKIFLLKSCQAFFSALYCFENASYLYARCTVANGFHFLKCMDSNLNMNKLTHSLQIGWNLFYFSLIMINDNS